MSSKKNRQHKLRLKKRGYMSGKKILGKYKAKSPRNVLHRLKAKSYRQRTTKRRYNKSKR